MGSKKVPEDFYWSPGKSWIFVTKRVGTLLPLPSLYLSSVRLSYCDAFCTVSLLSGLIFVLSFTCLINNNLHHVQRFTGSGAVQYDQHRFLAECRKRRQIHVIIMVWLFGFVIMYYCRVFLYSLLPSSFTLNSITLQYSHFQTYNSIINLLTGIV